MNGAGVAAGYDRRPRFCRFGQTRHRAGSERRVPPVTVSATMRPLLVTTVLRAHAGGFAFAGNVHHGRAR